MGVKVRDDLKNQKGAAMLIFMVILILGATAYLVADFNLLKSKADQEQQTLQALNEAKLAVIGWSLNKNISCNPELIDAEQDCILPGRLPCPEDLNLIGTVNEGNSRTSCDEAIAIGRLPWKTLGIGDLRDGHGDKLWFAISSGFRAAPININTVATLKVNQQANGVVAIIFSPGQPLAGQKRINQTDIAQYLDLTNINGVPSFLTGLGTQDFNDVLAVISKDDLFKAVNMRVLGEVRGAKEYGGLIDFYSNYGTYPYADTNGLGQSEEMRLTGTPSYQGVIGRDLYFVPEIKTMLLNNGWLGLIQYQVNAQRTEVSLKLGNQTMQIKPSL